MGEQSAGERAWVKTLVPWLGKALADASTEDRVVEVCDSYELAYTNEVREYD